MIGVTTYNVVAILLIMWFRLNNGGKWCVIKIDQKLAVFYKWYGSWKLSFSVGRSKSSATPMIAFY